MFPTLVKGRLSQSSLLSISSALSTNIRKRQNKAQYFNQMKTFFKALWSWLLSLWNRLTPSPTLFLLYAFIFDDTFPTICIYLCCISGELMQGWDWPYLRWLWSSIWKNMVPKVLENLNTIELHLYRHSQWKGIKENIAIWI